MNIDIFYMSNHRYNFCDDFFGEESIFFEIFAGNFDGCYCIFCVNYYKQLISNRNTSVVQVLIKFYLTFKS